MSLSSELLKFLDIADDIAAIRAAVEVEIPNKLREMETRMSEREDAAYEHLTVTIQAVKDGWSALIAERDALKAALEQAGVDAAAVLEADSQADAAKVEAADAALAELVTPPAPPVE